MHVKNIPLKLLNYICNYRLIVIFAWKMLVDIDEDFIILNEI